MFLFYFIFKEFSYSCLPLGDNGFHRNIFWSVSIKHVLNFANVVSLYVAKSLGDKEIVKGLGKQKCT